MTIEHHDLIHEFPELRERIHELKIGDAHFRKLFDEYHELTSEIEKNDGTDPGHIVIDEIAGQWLTFLFIGHLSVVIVLAGFILFRLFDILKPLGINKIQELKGGWGVMLDDVLAAIYANTILHLLILTGIIS